MNIIFHILVGIVFCLISFNANAEIVFNNGMPYQDTPSGGVTSDTAWPHAWVDDFNLSSNSNQVDTIVWWGTTSSGNFIDVIDSFIITIYSDDNGSPAKSNPDILTPIGKINKKLIDYGYNRQFIQYEATITPMSFTPNTPYWLGIQWDDSYGFHPLWIWKASSDIGNAHHRDGSYYDWELYYNTTRPNWNIAVELGRMNSFFGMHGNL